MTTATTAAPDLRSRDRAASPYRLSAGRLVRAEFLKLLTLRSTWWSLALTLLLTVGMAMLIGAASEGNVEPVTAAVLPIQFTMLLAGILGAIERHCHDVFAGRAKLSTLQKLARLPAAVKLARCEVGDQVPDVF